MDCVNKPLIFPCAEGFDRIGIQYGQLTDLTPVQKFPHG